MTNSKRRDEQGLSDDIERACREAEKEFGGERPTLDEKWSGDDFEILYVPSETEAEAVHDEAERNSDYDDRS